MLLIDVNLLVHSADQSSPEHAKAKGWLEGVLKREIIALPWAVLVGFVRVVTNPRISKSPMSLNEAHQAVYQWISTPSVKVIEPGPQHWRYFYEACKAVNARGNLVTDAHLAALAMEHNCEIASSDLDFAKFPGLRWRNPLAVLN